MNSSNFPESSPTRYLTGFGLLAASILLGVALVNYWIDPYLTHQWDSPLLQRLQATGEKLTPWGKTYAVFKYQPQVLYVGNSRTHWGLPPDPHLFGGRRVFNGAMAGASLGDAISMLKHARTVTKLDTVVWGVDYWGFSFEGAHPDFAQELVAVDRFYVLYRPLLDLKRSLSFDMISDSIHLLSGRTEKVCRSSLALHGQRDEACITANLSDRGGVDKALIKDVRATKGENVRISEALPAFRSELGRLCQADVHIMVYVNPLHSLTLENFYRNGHIHELEQWKRLLVNVTSLARQGGCNVQLFDFSGFNSVTSEAIPEVSGRAAMQNYWEGSHYRAVVGRQILAKMLLFSEVAVPPDFGVELDPINMEVHFERIRLERELYRAAHPQELALLDKWFGPGGQKP